MAIRDIYPDEEFTMWKWALEKQGSLRIGPRTAFREEGGTWWLGDSFKPEESKAVQTIREAVNWLLRRPLDDEFQWENHTQATYCCRQADTCKMAGSLLCMYGCQIRKK